MCASVAASAVSCVMRYGLANPAAPAVGNHLGNPLLAAAFWGASTA